MKLSPKELEEEEEEEDEEHGPFSKPYPIAPLLPTLHRILYEWFVLQERMFLLLSLVGIAASAGLGLLLPKLAGDFLDSMEQMDDHGALLWLVVVVSLNQGISGLVSLGLNYVAENFAVRLREKTFAALISKPQLYFDSTPKQEMLQANLGDIDCIRTVVSQEAALLWERLVTALGGVIAIALVSQTLALYTLLIAPIVAFSLSFVGERIVYPLEQKARETIVECSESLDENFNNVHIVHSFGMEHAVANRFHLPVQKRFEADRQSVFGLTLFKGSIYYVAGMVLLFACWYGRNMVRFDHTIKSGDLMAFLVYALQIALALANSTRGLALCNLGYVCALKTFALLDDTLKINLGNQGDGQEMVDMSQVQCDEIRFENVTFAYPTRGRRNVKPSGAGKSSVVALLEKFYLPIQGRILIDGKFDLKHLSTKLWRNQIGLVTQDACLFSGTIYENIALGRPNAMVTSQEIQHAAEMANVIEFSQHFPLGLHQQIGHRGNHLSSGQKQRVAIARAVLRNPKILLLDEHTSALDAHSERLIQDSLMTLQLDRMTLMIAHRLQTARRADMICVLTLGQIVEQGTHDELIQHSNGVYHALWLAQLNAQQHH
ncbi:hypothetical protein BASA81_006427 [Batrachochytrium salamandrivorans]|nr:hypothetical protein BASA81_006427 [Batrachochytrium salamandrivorans]